MVWGKPAGNRGRLAAVALVAAAACVGAVLFASEVSRPTALEACTPCTSGEGCVAGCLSPAVELRIAEAHKRAADVRLQQLSDHNTAIPQYADVLHSSLHDQENAIEQRNKELLQLRNSQTQAQQGLGGVLNAALKQVVRAEASEVKLRRQAELTKGASVASVFTSLSPSDQELFKLRAKEFELALKEADKDLIVASNAMAPLTPAVVPEAAETKEARTQDLAQTQDLARKPSWTSAMSQMIANEFTDGHGATWGLGKKAAVKRAHMRAEFRKSKLPGVEMNNWELTKGRLAVKPKGDDPLLPGVRTHGW